MVFEKFIAAQLNKFSNLYFQNFFADFWDFIHSGLMTLTLISGVYCPSQRLGPSYLESA